MEMDAGFALAMALVLALVLARAMVESPSPRPDSPNGVRPHFLNHWRR